VGSTSGRKATKVAEQLTFSQPLIESLVTKWQLQQLIEERGLQNFKKVKNRETFHFVLNSLNLGGEFEEKSSSAQWPCQESVLTLT
jgi:hypothetical protein